VVSLSPNEWKPPIIKTVALSGEGIKDLADAILKHRDFLGERLKEKRISRMVEHIENLLTKRFLNKVRQKYDIRRMFEGGNFKNPYEVLGILEREFLD